MPTPSFLYFDMGNVLLKFSHRRGAEQMAAVTGLSEETVYRIVYGTTGENGLHWNFERGEFTPDEFYSRIYQLANCKPRGTDHSELARACNDLFTLNEAMLPLVTAIKQAGRRIGVLSNTSCEHWDFVTAKFPQIMDLFPLHALSCTLRQMKPDAAMYARAAELCETPPGEIFFTDDRPENVAAAKAAGWDAVVFTGVEPLRAALVERGLSELHSLGS